MKGAREYANLFVTGQYGRLYLVSGLHARGKTFRIFVLPEGETAAPNGSHNAPLNYNTVEVYGVISGQPGWTEEYGWLYHGKWKDDFFELVVSKYAELERLKEERLVEESKTKEKEELRKKQLLDSY